jgi:inner membrane protein
VDSLTQAALGAGVAAICVRPEHRRRALLAGALLGTLPDLDVLIDYGDAVSNFTRHRGFSHSLIVLPAVALALWLALRRLWRPVREEPRRWLAAIMLALVTHPLLDAHTAYGTQLLWPLPATPVMWSTLFIIDPLYTLPLVVAGVLVAVWPQRRFSRRALGIGLLLSSAYLGWSWVAKTAVEHEARTGLAAAGLAGAPVFSVPTPLNTLLWRVVVRTEAGYLEGFVSLLAGRGTPRFTAYASDQAALDAAMNVRAVRRLRWFADDFVRADVEKDVLIVTDLRMGQEPAYVFRHAVARRGNPGWQPIETEQVFTLLTRQDVARVWDRLLDP